LASPLLRSARFAFTSPVDAPFLPPNAATTKRGREMSGDDQRGRSAAVGSDLRRTTTSEGYPPSKRRRATNPSGPTQSVFRCCSSTPETTALSGRSLCRRRAFVLAPREGEQCADLGPDLRGRLRPGGGGGRSTPTVVQRARIMAWWAEKCDELRRGDEVIVFPSSATS
jgi:hypothetical protein